MEMKIVLVALFLFFSCFSSVYSTECYYCNSTYIQRHNECVNGDLRVKINCYNSPCFAAKYEVKSTNMLVPVTYRGCWSQSTSCTDIRNRLEASLRNHRIPGGYSIISAFCETCNSDGCNSSSKIITSVFALLAGFLIIRFC